MEKYIRIKLPFKDEGGNEVKSNVVSVSPKSAVTAGYKNF